VFDEKKTRIEENFEFQKFSEIALRREKPHPLRNRSIWNWHRSGRSSSALCFLVLEEHWSLLRNLFFTLCANTEFNPYFSSLRRIGSKPNSFAEAHSDAGGHKPRSYQNLLPQLSTAAAPGKKSKVFSILSGAATNAFDHLTGGSVPVGSAELGLDRVQSDADDP